MTTEQIKNSTKGMTFTQAANFLDQFKSLTLIRDMRCERLYRSENKKSEFGYISVALKSLLSDQAEVKFIPNY